MKPFKLASNLVAAAFTWFGLAVGAHAAPAMWVASDADTRIWLFGSVHLLPKGTEWRSPAFEEALGKASFVYFEASLDTAAQEQLSQNTFRLGLVPSGTRLLDSLDADEKAVVVRAAKLAGVPLSGLDIWKPWMAANLLTMKFATRRGYDFYSGVDMTLQGEVPPEQQRFFEAADDQLGMLAGMPADQQVGLLVATARDLEANPDTLDAMVDAWARGDLDDLQATVASSVELADPNWSDTLLYQRNVKWVQDLKALMEEPGDFLVVVGAAHLIGEGSVPDLLKSQGIKVERVQ